jgi:hypothetical protein
MREIYLFKVPETFDSKAFNAPITIMTRSPVAKEDPDYLIWAIKIYYFIKVIDDCSHIILI